MINKYGYYSAEYNMDFGETEYTKSVRYGQPEQPFIHVMDRPVPFSEFKPQFEDSSLDRSLIIQVSSGSHVSIDNIIHASKIYDTTKSIYRLLKRKLSKSAGLEFLFDDEKQLYIPSKFIRLIIEAA